MKIQNIVNLIHKKDWPVVVVCIATLVGWANGWIG
jgi:hypothetical protein